MKVLFSLMIFILLFTAFSYAQITSDFTGFWSFTNGASPAMTAWWDVNGDNYYDVVVGSQYNGKPWLRVVKNDGTTLWSYQGSLSDKVNWVAFEDMDNDNDKDLAVAAGSRAWVFKDIGSTLSSNPDWSVTTGNAVVVAWGNYNNDNRMDLAVAVNGAVKIYNGLATGNLSTTPGWTWTFSSGTVRSLSFGQLTSSPTGNQRQSLAVGIEGVDEEGNAVYVFENTGSTLPSSPTWTNNNAYVGVFGDFNNDEADDIFINYHASTTDARVYLSDDGNITGNYINALENPAIGGLTGDNLLVADFNSDGYNDLAMKYIGDANSWSVDFDSDLILYYNDNGTAFQTDYFYLPPGDQPSPPPDQFWFGDISAEDLNNDGDLELFNGYFEKEWEIDPPPPVLTWEGIGIKYFENQGNAAPAPPQHLSLTGQPGEHPTLNWNENRERDFAHYEVWRYRHLYDNEYIRIAPNVTDISYVDEQVTIASGWQPAGGVYYKLKAVDNASNVSDFSNEVNTFEAGNSSRSERFADVSSTLVPEKISLFANYPNPFNPTTTITFYLPTDQNVSLTVYSLTGEKVATLLNGFTEKGVHNLNWNGTNQSGSPVSSGIYVYQLQAGDKRLVKKMLLAK